MKNVNEKRKRTPESVVIVLYLRIINIYNEDNNFQKIKTIHQHLSRQTESKLCVEVC